MKNSLLLFLLLFIISCGTQQKNVNSTEKNNETVFTIIDSVQKKFDEIAQRDSLNATQNKNLTWKTKKDNPIRDYGELTKQHFKHDIWNELLQKYVSVAGNVNYKGLKEERRKLLEYLYDLGENKPSENWSKNEKLAYWINAYNAMTVDLILDSYPARKGIKEIRNPWKQRRWKIEGKAYNLDEIEHDILRKMNEPRIHFAINCASFSCPPLLNEAYTAAKLEQQLTQVTKAFLADSKRNTITKDQLELSKIFKWFAKDFKQNGSVIDFLNLYTEIDIEATAKISYKKYDWSLNE
jgi:hypothetical protein